MKRKNRPEFSVANRHCFDLLELSLSVVLIWLYMEFHFRSCSILLLWSIDHEV